MWFLSTGSQRTSEDGWTEKPPPAPWSLNRVINTTTIVITRPKQLTGSGRRELHEMKKSKKWFNLNHTPSSPFLAVLSSVTFILHSHLLMILCQRVSLSLRAPSVAHFHDESFSLSLFLYWLCRQIHLDRRVFPHLIPVAIQYLTVLLLSATADKCTWGRSSSSRRGRFS